MFGGVLYLISSIILGIITDWQRVKTFLGIPAIILLLWYVVAGLVYLRFAYKKTHSENAKALKLWRRWAQIKIYGFVASSYLWLFALGYQELSFWLGIPSIMIFIFACGVQIWVTSQKSKYYKKDEVR